MTISEFVNKVGFKVKDEDVKKVNDSVKGIKDTATKLLGAIGIGFSLAAINGLVEEFGTVNNAIRNSVGELGNMEDVQNLILDTANECRASYSDMANTVSNLVKSSSDLFPVEDAAAYTGAVTKLLKSAGRSEAVIQSVMEGLNKSFQKGIVDTETLNKLLEQAPEAANVLASHLGVAKTQLLDIAANGQMKVTDLKNAFLDSADEINAAFGNVDMTISDALKSIRNKWGLWLAQTDKTLGITKTIGKVMVTAFNGAISVLNRVRTAVVWMSEKLGGSEKLLKFVAIAASAIFIAFNFSKITDGFNTVVKLLGKMKLSTLAMAAIFILLALLVEDFIKFMQGEDSLFGELLKKAGVDVDKFRGNILKIWEKLKVILPAIWQGIKNVGIPIFKGLWEAIKAIFSAIGKVIEAVAPKFADMLDQLANGEVDTASWEKFGEVIGTIASVILGVVAAIKVIIAVKKAWAVVQGIVNAVMSASPITLIIMAIVALIAIIVLLVKNWDKVKAAAAACWNWIKGIWNKVATWFKTNVIDPIVNFFKGLWDGIVNIFKGIWDSVVGAFKSIIDWVKTNWKSIVAFIINPFAGIFKYLYDNFEGFRSFVDNIVNNIKDFFIGLWESIKSAWSAVAEWFTEVFQAAWDGIVNIWNAVVGWFQGVWDGIVGVFSSVGSWFAGIFKSAWEGIKNAFSTVGSFFQGIWDNIKSMFTKIGTAIGDGISGAFKSVVNGVIGFASKIINGFIDSINWAIDVINNIPGVNISKLSRIELQGLAEGGYVGANKPTPVVIGDNKSEGEIVSPISKMRDTVIDALKTFVAAGKPSGATQVLSNSTSNRSIVQNVEINNEFNGDKAIQKQAAKTMDKSAEDVTAFLARGLAFAK